MVVGLCRCLVCGERVNGFLALANHVSRKHGREARDSYKRGYWIAMDNEPNLFSGIDNPQPEIAERKDEASITGTAPVATSPATEVNQLEQSPSIVKVPEGSPSPYFIEPKADLIVGDTGSGKTTNIGEISDYVLAKYGKLTRMVGADKGGFGPLTGLIKSGQVEYWAVNAWKNPIAAMHHAVRGHWPLRLDDPESPLVPPDAGTWEVYGFGAIEGLTSFGDAIIQELKDKKASLSQDPSYTWATGGVEFSGGNQSYYGFMQDQLGDWVGKSHLLGYERILWTALESKGQDESGGWVYGPMIGGKKAAKKAGNWFCNYFHMDVIPAADGSAKHVLFLRTHIDPMTKIPFPCKVRAPKAYSKDVPDKIESGSIAEAYKLLDSLYEKQTKESVSKMSEISGLRDRLMERAVAARRAEAAAADKRAKAAGLLKPMVTVVGGPVVTQVRSAGSAGTVPAAIPAGPVKPVAPVPATSSPLQVPTIQNVRKSPQGAKEK